MIGQKQILKQLDNLIESNKFPRFIVITGQKGQGKKLLSKEISKKLNYPLVISGIKIDEIRDIIELSYKQTEPIIYLIPDADKMSVGAKNSLLKVIEEPPNNAYFIITLQQLENTLETIKSRCYNIQLENYAEEELNEMINQLIIDIDSKDRHILLDSCQNYYQIQLFNRYGIQDFYNYVDKVVNNIYKVQSANSFKLAEKLDIKNDGNGYDINLFFEVFNRICFNNAIMLMDNNENDDFRNYIVSIDITSSYQRKLFITGINRQSLIDLWILDIRKLWRE